MWYDKKDISYTVLYMVSLKSFYSLKIVGYSQFVLFFNLTSSIDSFPVMCSTENLIT